MTHSEIREKFLKFFEERGHKIVPSSSLLPTDPSVLFTTAGMQQFKPYYTGQGDALTDFGSKRVASIQKSMRTSDIDEVGDKSHLTFFEMLGHFSFGDYFKKETIEWTYLLLTDVFKISPDRISATVFAGDEKIQFDSESYHAWSQFLPVDRIRKGPRADNVWGPAGPEGPCGIANEIYVDDLEVATLVFMEYYCDKNQNLAPLLQNGVDVGWGFERLVKMLQDKDNIFETDLFEPIFDYLPTSLDLKIKRIITDHSRSIAFLVADGVRPSNKERGYVLRRLMRRIITYQHFDESKSLFLNQESIFRKIIEIYFPIYPELNSMDIISEFKKERDIFNKTLRQGLNKFNDFVLRRESKNDKIGVVHDQKILYGKDAFYLYQSFGFPREVTKDLCEENNIVFDDIGFEEEKKKHQEISRAGAEKKFGGHGLLVDTGELKAGNEEELKKATRLHTATHLLHASLRKVLGTEVHQAGSDITAERLRFDFTFPRKITLEEIKQVEDLVNEAVQKDYKVTKEEMSYEDAIKSGAMAFFKLKYPPMVNVYSIGSSTGSGLAFSRELCGGPHVSHTSEIGKFRITKEEAVSAGARRIRAIVD